MIHAVSRLAIEGGAPVRRSFLPYHQPLIDGQDEQAVLDTLRSGWLTTGPKTKRLEQELAAYTRAVRSGPITPTAKRAPERALIVPHR